MNFCNHCGEVPKDVKVFNFYLYINYGTFRDHSTGRFCIPCLKEFFKPNGYGTNSHVMEATKLIPLSKEDWE